MRVRKLCGENIIPGSRLLYGIEICYSGGGYLRINKTKNSYDYRTGRGARSTLTYLKKNLILFDVLLLLLLSGGCSEGLYSFKQHVCYFSHPAYWLLHGLLSCEKITKKGGWQRAPPS